MFISVLFQTKALLLISGCVQTYDPVKKQRNTDGSQIMGHFLLYISRSINPRASWMLVYL